jgi:phosphoglucosamine mutase
MSRTHFGTDGIRGTVGTSPITADFMLRLGHAVGRVLRRNAGKATVLIGKDTRVSGYMIESALEAGFASAGVDVLLTGPLPTPGVAYLTRALRVDLGVVISASHNPFGDNGVKFFSALGEKLPDEWEIAVEAALEEPAQWVDSAALGKARRLDDAAGRYLEFCKSTFAQDLSLKGLKIVVDGAHGAAYSVAPKVFHELGAEVVTIGCEPDGFNINAGVGATAPQALVRAVKEQRADYGIALDGDADRLQMVDAAGTCYDGDELLYAVVSDRLARGLPVPWRGRDPDDQHGDRAGAEVARCRDGACQGRRPVCARGTRRARLAARRRELGPSADARSAHHGRRHCQFAAGAAGGAPKREVALGLLDGVRLFPQELINVRVASPAAWRSNATLTAEMARVERELGDEGRVLIRPSGTEPVLRVMVEARDGSQARGCAQRLAVAAQAA